MRKREVDSSSWIDQGLDRFSLSRTAELAISTTTKTKNQVCTILEFNTFSLPKMRNYGLNLMRKSEVKEIWKDRFMNLARISKNFKKLWKERAKKYQGKLNLFRKSWKNMRMPSINSKTNQVETKELFDSSKVVGLMKRGRIRIVWECTLQRKSRKSSRKIFWRRFRKKKKEESQLKKKRERNFKREVILVPLSCHQKI